MLSALAFEQRLSAPGSGPGAGPHLRHSLGLPCCRCEGPRTSRWPQGSAPSSSEGPTRLEPAFSFVGKPSSQKVGSASRLQAWRPGALPTILADGEPESRGHRLSRVLWPAARAGDTLLSGYPFVRISLQAPYRPIGRFPKEPQPSLRVTAITKPWELGVDFPRRLRQGFRSELTGSGMTTSQWSRAERPATIALRRHPLPFAPNVPPEYGVTPMRVTCHLWPISLARTRSPARTATL